MSILLLIAAVVLWVKQASKPYWEPKNAPASARAAGSKVKQARSPA
jgi:hypothetical protein